MSFNLEHYKNRKIHFIGIGGISMSGIAEILMHSNYKISGSDMKSSPITEKLSAMGAEIYIGHSADNLKNVALVVYTAAISKDNPEYIGATILNVPMMNRAEFLGELMKNHKYNVAIAGTHGKTTTTSMFSHVTLAADLDPTILVGGNLDIIKGNVRTGNSEYFVTEACEYTESFLKFYPHLGIILNIDADHLDYYRDIDHIEEAFTKFAALIPQNGYLVVCGDDERCLRVASTAKCTTISYGINNGDILAKNIIYKENGAGSFEVYKGDIKLFDLSLNVPGKHNVLNALASVAASICLDIPFGKIIEGIQSFGGTHRRFELKGSINGITVIDDYAHHPTEIKATLEATKNYPHNKIYCVFQPHTYTRTSSLFSDFTHSFYNTDKLILADIYAAREKDTGVVSSDMLGAKIRENGVDCINLHSFLDIVKYLKENATEGDLILTVGAGDVFNVGEMFLK